MRIDLAVVVVVLFFGGLGLWSGAIRQLAHLGGLLAGWFAARPLAHLVGPAVAERLGYPLLVTTIGCSFVTFFLVYVLAVFALRFLLARMLPDGEHGWLNRVGGFGLGAVKAAILAFVLLSMLVVAERHVGTHLTRLWPAWPKQARQSLAMNLARHHGLFASLPAVGSLERLLKARRDPQAAATLAEDPQFKALAQDPRVRAMVDDAGIRRALQEGDSAALLSSVKVLEALNDPRFVERLTSLGAGKAEPPKKPAPAPATPPASPPR